MSPAVLQISLAFVCSDPESSPSFLYAVAPLYI